MINLSEFTDDELEIMEKLINDKMKIYYELKSSNIMSMKDRRDDDINKLTMLKAKIFAHKFIDKHKK